VTRFGLGLSDVTPDFPVRVRLLTQTDIVKILGNSFLLDFDHQKAAFERPDGAAIRKRLAELRAKALPKPPGDLDSDDVLDLIEYFDTFFAGVTAELRTEYWREAIELAPRLSGRDRAKLWSVLWYDFQPFTDLYLTLYEGLEKLAHAPEALLGMDALIPREKSIIDVLTLDKLGADAALAQNVTTHEKFEELDWSKVDNVVEAVTEDLELKQRLFAEVEALARPEVPLMSNTSNFPIGEIGKHLKNRGRVLGLHFFMPAHLVPLVEVVSSDATDPKLAQEMVDLMKKLGKAPIWVKKDVPGFVGNRIQHAMMREALYLIDEGICDAEAVDTAVRYGFGFRFIACGPIMQKELSGWDTNFLVGSALYPHLYKNDGPPKILKDMVDKKHLGMKTKRGFWEWTEEKMAKEKARIERALQAGMAILKDDK